MRIRKYQLLVITLALFLMAYSCQENKKSADSNGQPKAIFKIPYDANFSNHFSLDGHDDEFIKYKAYQIISDTPDGIEAENWTPNSKDLFFKTTLVVDDNYLYFFADVRDDDPRNIEDVYEAWMGDALEYYIGLYDISEVKTWETKRFSRSHGDWRLSFMPTGFFALDGWLINDVPGVESVVFRKFSKDGYIVEARLTLDSLVADGRDFKVYDGLKIPLKIDIKDQDLRKEPDLSTEEKWTLALGSGGIPAASRFNDVWKYPRNWNIAEIVGAPPMEPEVKNRIPDESPPTLYYEDPIDLKPRAFASLKEAISNAKTLLKSNVEGEREGQFPAGSKSDLQKVIQGASDFLKKETTDSTIVAAISSIYDACSIFESLVNVSSGNLVDQNANQQTRYLHANLKKQMGHSFLFGMQHATGYGVGWKNDDDRSDVKEVCGDFPAIHGEDLREALQGGDKETRMQYRIINTYERGGIITISWHQLDPDNRYWNSDRVNYENIVSTIIPGGARHKDYVAKLDLVADFFKSLRGKNGEAIPIIFRPFHEHYGSWFWWGIGQCSTDEFNQLWRFTVEYLRDKKNVHNLLWAISPNLKFLDRGEDYFDRFPGDDYVDIYGVDFYYNVPLNNYAVANYKRRLNSVVQIALKHEKIPAITEIGQDRLADPNWHSRTMINPLKYDSLNRYIAYGVTWRNEGTGHFHVPYPGHYTVPDFLEFYRDPFTLFESDLPGMYTMPKPYKTDITSSSSFNINKSPSVITWSDPRFSIENWKRDNCSLGSGTDAENSIEKVRTAYFVKDIELDNKPEAAHLILQYNGGYVLCINGIEIFRYNVPGEMDLIYDSLPFSPHRNTKAVTFDDQMLNALKVGKNRIAVEVHGGSKNVEYFDALFKTNDKMLFYYGSEWAFYDLGTKPEDIIK